MIKLKYKGQDINVDPNVTVGIWQKLKSNEALYAENPANLLSLFLDLDPDEIKTLPKKNVDFIDSYLRSEFLQMESPKDPILTFTFEGQEYGLENDWNNLAWGAWADFEILSAGDVDKNIHHILAILYRPVVKHKGNKYVLKPYEPQDVLERAELFKMLPIKYWWSVSSFFFQAAKLSISGIKNSLTWRTRLWKLIHRGTKMLPKWIQRKVRLGTTLP